MTLPSGWGGLVEVSGRSHLRIIGLRVEHAGPDDNHAGILVDGSNDVTVQGCSTYDTASSGIGVWNSTSVTPAWWWGAGASPGRRIPSPRCSS